VERLVLVSTDRNAQPEPGPGYVYIDWGPEFYAKHSASFPDYVGMALTVNIGWLGLQHILENGGAGYFPMRLVRPHVETGRLKAPNGAPEFALPAYVVYPTDSDPELLGPALDSIRRVSATEDA
jgi:LysR family transcriptional regulator, flagellar master operon regulator